VTLSQLFGLFVHDDGVAPARAGTFLQYLRVSRTAPAFNAAPVPDATVATIWEPGAATAAVTWGVPTSAAVGELLILITTQDGVGGRAINYNAIYKTGGAAAVSTAASTKNIDVFYYDGTNWRIVSRLTGQAV
jgi:hypothetical protein